jgi:UPF0755 protein
MSRNFKIGLLVFISIIVSTFTFYGWQIAKTPNLQTEHDKDFVLYVPTNGTYEGILDSLKKNNVVRDEMSFRFLAKLLKLPQRLKAGRYIIKKNAGNYGVINKLRQGNQDAVRLTFNNIRLKKDLIARIGSKFEFGEAELAKQMNNPEICQKYGFDTTTIVGMFLPNSYEIYWNTKSEKLLDRMHSEYQKFWTAGRISKANAIGFTPVQAITMASIVDAETNKEDEMPRVAGAYMNRYKLPMPLQADPTVVFAWQDFGIKRVTKNLLAIKSPYNTYRNLGLPPGPINLPSTAAIDAVLNYEKHDYLYFCAKEDFSGYHTFAVSYDDHLNNARMYQATLNNRNIMK